MSSQSPVHAFRTRRCAKFRRRLIKKSCVLLYLSLLFVINRDYGVRRGVEDESANMLFHFFLAVPIRRIPRAVGTLTDFLCRAAK
jgi:hypothetical protein